jgi:transcriptional regulator with XRE-family HTH domain
MQAFGERLRAARLARKMDHKRLAGLLGVGLTSVYCWENGERFPHLTKLPQIAALLRVTPGYLVGD